MPALQCPDCGARHALDDVADRAAFRCTSCGRALKVPEQLRRGGAAAPRPTDWGDPRRDPAPSPATTAYHRPAPPRPIEVVPKGAPLLVRFALWIAALPITLWLTYRIARGLGFLTAKQVEDVFFEQAWGRFWPLVRLLPLWALLTALAVHLSVLGIERWRRRRAEQRVRGPRSKSGRSPARGRGRSSTDRPSAPQTDRGDEPTRVAPSADDARSSAR